MYSLRSRNVLFETQESIARNSSILCVNRQNVLSQNIMLKIEAKEMNSTGNKGIRFKKNTSAKGSRDSLCYWDFFLNITHSFITKLNMPENIKARRLHMTTLSPAK